VKPAPFSYVDPRSLPEALAALHQYGDAGKILAGGQSLVPLLNMRLAQPDVLIDINHVPDMDRVVLDNRLGRPGIAMGAMVRQSALERDHETLFRLPLLAEAIKWVGHPQIRNRGTVGGSIAHADPAAELPLVFLVLQGMATVRSARGERRIAADDLFVYTLTTALELDELMVEVWFPLPDVGTGQAFLEVARRHGDFALVAAAVSLRLDDDGRIGDAVIGIGGAAPTPMRARAAENLLRGERWSAALFRHAGTVAAGETEPTPDIHADAEYRREVAGTLVERALLLAARRVEKDAV
jgi:aerobic carbon-monoxide dehydrogenase medium subunit